MSPFCTSSLLPSLLGAVQCKMRTTCKNFIQPIIILLTLDESLIYVYIQLSSAFGAASNSTCNTIVGYKSYFTWFAEDVLFRRRNSGKVCDWGKQITKSTNTHSAIEKQMKSVRTVSKETIKLCYIVNLTLINLRWMRSKYAQIDAYSFTNWLKVLTLIWFLVKFSVVKTSNASLLLQPFPWVMMNSQLKMYTNTCNRIEPNRDTQ